MGNKNSYFVIRRTNMIRNGDNICDKTVKIVEDIEAYRKRITEEGGENVTFLYDERPITKESLKLKIKYNI